MCFLLYFYLISYHRLSVTNSILTYLQSQCGRFLASVRMKNVNAAIFKSILGKLNSTLLKMGSLELDWPEGIFFIFGIESKNCHRKFWRA